MDHVITINWKYRLLFYVGGFLFATVSYFAHILLFALESGTYDGVDVYEIVLASFAENPANHITSLIVWVFVCIAVVGIIGHILDKEVYYRKKAEQKANVDGLTDIYNHRFFQDRLQVEIERAARYERPLSLIILDIDDFKTFNDTWGHQEGDKLLKWFASLCQREIRTIDIVARYGGEEFAIMLPETGSKEARVLAERVRRACEKNSQATFGKNKAVTVSAGVASFPVHGETRHSLVLNADVALYYSKQMGKNRTCVFSEDYSKTKVSPEEKKTTLAHYDAGDEALESLGAALDTRDGALSGHSTAVARMAVALGERIGLSAEELSSLRAASLLHDVGTVVVPDNLLRKDGPLTQEEWQTVKSHVDLGASLLKRLQQMASIVPAIKHHHERFDGHGYPNNLAGENIPLLARVIAVTEAYDAMTKDRPYRKAISAEEAVRELKRCSGSQFDPDLVKAFVGLLEDTNQTEAA